MSFIAGGRTRISCNQLDLAPTATAKEERDCYTLPCLALISIHCRICIQKTITSNSVEWLRYSLGDT
jgi:hypothetical protein